MSNTGIDRLRQRIDTPQIGFLIQFTLIAVSIIFHVQWPMIVLMVFSVFGIYQYVRQHAAHEKANTSISHDCEVDEHYIEELTEYIHTSGIAHEKEATVEQVIKSLLEERKRLLGRLAEASNGIHLKGWWCTRNVPGKCYPCDTFNGEERTEHTVCRHCEQPKPVS